MYNMYNMYILEDSMPKTVSQEEIDKVNLTCPCGHSAPYGQYEKSEKLRNPVCPKCHCCAICGNKDPDRLMHCLDE
jgi:hypothetical protein